MNNNERTMDVTSKAGSSFQDFEKRVPENHWTRSNFGKKGWLLIVFVGIMLLFGSALGVDGLNVAVPAIAETRNWDYGTLLAFATPAGFVCVVGSFLIGIMTDKKGARFSTIVCLVVSAVSYVWYGNVTSMWQYFVALSLITTFALGAAWVPGGAYMAMYFPKKKGLALGWATMGNNLCTAAFVPLFTLMVAKMGINLAVVPIAIVILLWIIFTIFLPDNPENAGTTPDQIPMNKDEIDLYRKEANSYVSPWTYRKLLCCKELWMVSLTLGISMLITSGVVGQMIVRLTNTDVGWSTGKATAAMSVCAVIGIAGSYLYGFLDQKLGTKKAVFVYMIVYAVAAFLNATSIQPLMYVSVFLVGISIGGNANWPISLTSTVFGYRNFARVYTLVNPFFSFIKCWSFIVLAVCLNITGSMRGAYVAFGVLAIIGGIVAMLINDKRFADGTLGDMAGK